MGEERVPQVLLRMWGIEHDAPRRGPKPGLDLETIARAAIAIADAEGLHAVSMSRVAKALGFTTMSLYRYVESKDDLVLAIVDVAYGTPALPDTSSDWRTGLELWAQSLHRILVQHRWILEVPITEPPLSPNQLGWMELGLRALGPTRLTAQQKLSAMLLVDSYTRGQTALEIGVGTDSAEADRVYGERLMWLTNDRDHQHLRAAASAGALSDEGDFEEDEFGFGLGTVLDGINALVERQGSRQD
jgi:AcrR family transcriptional regulator